MQLEVLYQVGEFAHSLRGVRRREMTFEHGFHQAYGTIENCVGQNTSPVALLLLCPKIRRMQEHRELLIGKLEDHKENENELEGVCGARRTKGGGRTTTVIFSAISSLINRRARRESRR